MQYEEKNSTSTFLELSFNKSIDYIRTLISQLFQMLFIIVSVILFGRVLNLLIKKPAIAADDAEVENTNDKENEQSDDDEEEVVNPDTCVENKENSVAENTGWESIPIPNEKNIEPQSEQYPFKKATAQYRRKAISVGPIMRCASSQLIKTYDFKDGEERYSYDLANLDVDSGDLVNLAVDSGDQTTAENVCVPKWYFYSKTMLWLTKLTMFTKHNLFHVLKYTGISQLSAIEAGKLWRFWCIDLPHFLTVSDAFLYF